MTKAHSHIKATIAKILALGGSSLRGRRWSEAELSRFEAKVGFELPANYRHFLSDLGDQTPRFVFAPATAGLGQLRGKALAGLKRPLLLDGPVEGARARKLSRIEIFDGCLYLGTRSDGLPVWLALNVKKTFGRYRAGQVWVNGSGVGSGLIDTETPADLLQLELRWLQQQARKAADPKQLEAHQLRAYDQAIDVAIHRGRWSDAIRTCDEAMSACPQHFERWLGDMMRAQAKGAQRTLVVSLKWLRPRLRTIEGLLLAKRFYGMRFDRSELLSNLVEVLNRGGLHKVTVGLIDPVWSKRTLFGELPWDAFAEAAQALGQDELVGTLALRKKRA